VELFTESAPNARVDIRAAVGQERSQDLARFAHGLKGSCRNFGESSFSILCMELEDAALNGDLQRAQDLRAAAEKELAHLFEALEPCRKKRIHI
jgi:HPt (histidine-containing phosphotransfer) domain-containing protein